jgi:hypothetical protein
MFAHNVPQKETIAMGAKASRDHFDLPNRADPRRRCEAFRDADEAWLWTMAALMARRDGARMW